MRRPNGGYGAPVVERIKPECKKCVKPIKANGLCARHYMQSYRSGIKRVARHKRSVWNIQDRKLYRWAQWGDAGRVLGGNWDKVISNDGSCSQCGGPSVFGSCPVCQEEQ